MKKKEIEEKIFECLERHFAKLCISIASRYFVHMLKISNSQKNGSESNNQFIALEMNVIKKRKQLQQIVEKREPTYSITLNINQFNNYGKCHEAYTKIKNETIRHTFTVKQ